METLQLKKNRGLNLGIWGMALGYFGFYVPYSAMTKALSKGLLPGMDREIPGFELLPAVVIGSFFMFILLITISKWWKYVHFYDVFGLKIPFASNKWTFLSGIAAAFIIITTTLAYSFKGISIVFAALLMRGGVLLIAPFIDTVFKRKVHWYSWVALLLSLTALIVLFLEKGGYTLSIIAGLNIAFYLSGYFFRLQFMTHIAKSEDKEMNYRFFIEEMVVAMVAIVVIPAIMMFLGLGEISQQLSAGFTTFLASSLIIPALIIGALYACLYIFGTRIYLNHQENTYCIPVNRCASLLAGVTAAFILGLIYGQSFVSTNQLASASILITAICFLSVPSFRRSVATFPQQLYIFICPGNTGRSPMAQAICKAELSAHLRANGMSLEDTGIEIKSAGLLAKPGTPLSANAGVALNQLGIEVPEHKSKNLTAIEVDEASQIWCMSEKHRQMILERFPAAEGKAFCIDPDDSLIIPHGKTQEAYLQCAEMLKKHIQGHIKSGRLASLAS